MTFFLMETMLMTNKTNLCGCGGTGRHAALRMQCQEAWRFEPSHPHHNNIKDIGISVFSFDSVDGSSWFSGNCSACPSQTDGHNDEPCQEWNGPEVPEA